MIASSCCPSMTWPTMYISEHCLTTIIHMHVMHGPSLTGKPTPSSCRCTVFVCASMLPICLGQQAEVSLADLAGCLRLAHWQATYDMRMQADVVVAPWLNDNGAWQVWNIAALKNWSRFAFPEYWIKQREGLHGYIRSFGVEHISSVPGNGVCEPADSFMSIVRESDSITDFSDCDAVPAANASCSASVLPLYRVLETSWHDEVEYTLSNWENNTWSIYAPLFQILGEVWNSEAL